MKLSTQHKLKDHATQPKQRQKALTKQLTEAMKLYSSINTTQKAAQDEKEIDT